MTTPKPVKGWAILDANGQINVNSVWTYRFGAHPWKFTRVLITPIPTKRKAKGKRK